MARNREKLYPAVKMEYALERGLDEVEWERIVERLGRAPNEVEVAIFSALWSEDYSNKSSSSLLDAVDKELVEKLPRIPGSRLGLVDIGDGKLLAMRMVSNNHQSLRDSYFGAQTSLNQAVEELCAIGARPIALANLMRFGSADQGVNRKHFQKAVDGIGTYSNILGVPMVGGDLYFHDRYDGCVITNGCALGVVEAENLRTEAEVKYGNVLLYIGGKTGKDGLVEKVEEEEEELNEELKIGKKQENHYFRVSDPLLAGRLTAACAEAISEGVLTEVLPCGAGGLATAIFDMSTRIGKALRLDIDRVPVRVEGLAPREILLSESSNRLIAITTRENHRRLLNIFHKWDVEAVVVGEIVDEDGLIFSWNHYKVGDIPFQFAMQGSEKKSFDVVQFPPMLKRSDDSDDADAIRRRTRKIRDDWEIVRDVQDAANQQQTTVTLPDSLEDTWVDLLASPNLCSRRTMFERFDQTIGSNTILQAGGDSGVIRLSGTNGTNGTNGSDTAKGLAVTVDSNALYVSMEPYLGTVQTIAEGMRNLSASGARPVALAHCLNFGNPNRYKDVCDLAEAIRGLGDASNIWKIPIISESVSLYNDSEGNAALPTPTIAMVGILDDVSKACPSHYQKSGDRILVIGDPKNEIGCTEYSYYCHQFVNQLVPDIRFDKERKVCEFIRSLIDERLLQSAHDVSGGGVAVAFAECGLSRPKPIGAVLDVYQPEDAEEEVRADALLFGETSARFVVSCTPENEEIIRERCREAGIPISADGRVGGKELIIKGAAYCEVHLSTAFKIWARRMRLLLGLTETGEIMY